MMCPRTAPAGIQIQCTMLTYDAYGNPKGSEGTTLGMLLSISNGALDTTLGSVKFVKEGIYQGYLLPKIAGNQLSTLTYTTGVRSSKSKCNHCGYAWRSECT